MNERVVVLGAGYAGAGAITALERRLDDGTSLTWVSEHGYHLVLHEVHRAVRNPEVRNSITVPVEAVKAPRTEFVQDTVTGIDTDAREISLAGGSTVDYDYVLIALGSATAFYGIPGMRDHSLTLKNLDDALAINDAVRTAAGRATRADPARVVIGGAGLSGVQVAGEIAEYRDRHGAPLEITVVEALDEILPGNDPALQGAVRDLLADRGIEVLTDDPITEAAADRIHFDERDPLDYDVLVWTGGITGREALESAGLDANHNRVITDATFRTSDDRVFAVGDAAVVDLDGDPAPPTAQAAWQAAEVIAENVDRACRDQPLRRWRFEPQGTVLSVGEDAVAHDVDLLPVTTFGGFPARTLKKLIAARWIASITSWPRALSAWNHL